MLGTDELELTVRRPRQTLVLDVTVAVEGQNQRVQFVSSHRLIRYPTPTCRYALALAGYALAGNDALERGYVNVRSWLAALASALIGLASGRRRSRAMAAQRT